MAAPAEAYMGDRWVKEEYLSKVQPPALGRMLQMRSDDPLQVLMAHAAELAPTFKFPPPTQSTNRGKDM